MVGVRGQVMEYPYIPTGIKREMMRSVEMYMYSITCPQTPTKSLAAILNLPTNLFYLLDSVLALTSDNFSPIHPSRNPMVAPFINSLVTPSLRVFTKTTVPVKISRCSFRVFLCVYPSVISSISGQSFHFPFPYFVIYKNVSFKKFTYQPWTFNKI